MHPLIALINLDSDPNEDLTNEVGEESAHHLWAENLDEEVIEIGSDNSRGCNEHKTFAFLLWSIGMYEGA